MIAAKTLRFPAFLAFWLTVLTISFLIVRSSPFPANSDLLGPAVTIDIVVLVPAAYLLLARRFGWRPLSVVPVVALSLAAAHLLIPAENQGFLQGFELLVAPLELFLIVYLVLKVRAVRRGCLEAGVTAGDFLETLEKVLEDTTDMRRPAQIISAEVAMLYYGLTGWWKQPVPTAGRTSFSYHRNSGHGLIMSVFLFLIGLEIAVTHWLLLPRIAWLAWVVFALGLYSCLFLLADLNAARLRPIHVEGGTLIFRVALRWRARIPLASITRVERSTLDIEDREGLLSAPLAGNQDVILHLDRDLVADGLYGFQRTFNRLAFNVDDVEGFVQALEAGGTRTS